MSDKLKKGDKVYLISKSYGDSWEFAIDRLKKYRYEIYNTKKINYEGEDIESVIGYFNYKFSGDIYVIDYYENIVDSGGDLYKRNDFVTEKELKDKIMIELPDSMFEI